MAGWFALSLVIAAAPPVVVEQKPATPRVGVNEARALAELVTISVAREAAFDVLSSADLRRVVELESEKQAVGCSEEASCLAEVAGAMGARFVVFGQVATLGTQIVLTLNLFDSDAGSSSGRVVVRGASLDEVMAGIDGAVDQLVKGALPGEVGAARVRVLVLDLDAPKAAEAPPVVESNTTVVVEGEQLGGGFWLLLGGGGAALVGAGALAGGGLLAFLAYQAHERASNTSVQLERKAALDERNAYMVAADVLGAAGALVLLGGGAAAVASFFVDGEE